MINILICPTWCIWITKWSYLIVDDFRYFPHIVDVMFHSEGFSFNGKLISISFKRSASSSLSYMHLVFEGLPSAEARSSNIPSMSIFYVISKTNILWSKYLILIKVFYNVKTQDTQLCYIYWTWKCRWMLVFFGRMI